MLGGEKSRTPEELPSYNHIFSLLSRPEAESSY
jgi:hypothetical protein